MEEIPRCGWCGGFGGLCHSWCKPPVVASKTEGVVVNRRESSLFDGPFVSPSKFEIKDSAADLGDGVKVESVTDGPWEEGESVGKPRKKRRYNLPSIRPGRLRETQPSIWIDGYRVSVGVVEGYTSRRCFVSETTVGELLGLKGWARHSFTRLVGKVIRRRSVPVDSRAHLVEFRRTVISLDCLPAVALYLTKRVFKAEGEYEEALERIAALVSRVEPQLCAMPAEESVKADPVKAEPEVVEAVEPAKDELVVKRTTVCHASLDRSHLETLIKQSYKLPDGAVFTWGYGGVAVKWHE